jgi:hypothetical protein
MNKSDQHGKIRMEDKTAAGKKYHSIRILRRSKQKI